MRDKIMDQNLASVDFSKFQPLHQKRTLAFVNHFVVTNVQFLNNFMKKCEQRLMQFERKLEKVNAAMVLLETRLSSIPEVNTLSPTKEDTVVPTEDNNNNTDLTDFKATEEIIDKDQDSQTSVVQDDIKQEDTKVARPEYDRFIKMVQVGVPVQAVKLKLSLEGLDPNLLDEMLSR